MFQGKRTFRYFSYKKFWNSNENKIALALDIDNRSIYLLLCHCKNKESDWLDVQDVLEVFSGTKEGPLLFSGKIDRALIRQSNTE